MSVLSSMRTCIRTLLHAPGFALTVILTLALGAGLSTAVLTVANATLLRELPVREQDRLFTLAPATPVTLKTARDFAAQARTLDGVAWVAYEGAWPMAIRMGDNITRMRRALVSGNYFDVLGTRAELGRALRPSDDVGGADPVVVISHTAWQTRFGGTNDVLGRTLLIEEFGVTARIVGVVPEGREYPARTEFWGAYTPARVRSEEDTTGYTAVTLLARLAPTATAKNAEDELTAFFSRSPSRWLRDQRGASQPLVHAILGDVRPAVIAFTAAAALLLLITCINVANLLLVRGLARVREIGVRTALGASRWQVIAQLLTENAALAAIGGALGVAFATGAVQLFLAFAPAGIPLLHTVRVDGNMLIVALSITASAMLLAGVAPAVVTARADIQGMLRSDGRDTGRRDARFTRELLVGAQMALAVLMLSAAALIGRSLMKLQGATLGFDATRVLVAELAIRFDRYPSVEGQVGQIRLVIDALRATPGVQGVSPVVAMPFSGTGGWTGRARLPGQAAEQASKNPMVNIDVVTPEYFGTMGMRALRGRLLTEADVRGAEPVAVVSETMARRYWPNEDAIGKRFAIASGAVVVGIVPDTRYRDLREALPSAYFPLAQSTYGFAPTTLVIRTAGSPAASVSAVRAVIDNAAPGVALANAASFTSYVEGPLATPRVNAFLLAVFALTAAALAGIGLFSVMATMVRLRTRELGLRMALGATSGRIRRMVLARGLAIAAAGGAVGMAAALLTNQLLSSLLYEVSPTDLLTMTGVGVLLLSISVMATLVPAHTTARIQPSVALRSEG